MHAQNVHSGKFCICTLNLRILILQTTISDLVQISPEDLGKSNAEAIEDNLNSKYANKVVSETERKNL